MRPSELEANDSTKISFVQNLNNPIKIYYNKSIYYFMFCFSLNIYEYRKYEQDHYYHNRPENHRHTHIIEYFSFYQLKKVFEILSKHNGAAFISESFVWNLCISTPLTTI